MTVPPALSPALTGFRHAASRRLLLVDDNHDFLDSLAQILEASGFEVLTSRDGPSALSVARTSAPEVILLDIGLPGMDGYEVARLLRSEPKVAPCLLVAMSGYSPDSERAAGAAPDFDHYLLKPIDLPRLLELLGRTGDAIDLVARGELRSD